MACPTTIEAFNISTNGRFQVLYGSKVTIKKSNIWGRMYSSHKECAMPGTSKKSGCKWMLMKMLHHLYVFIRFCVWSESSPLPASLKCAIVWLFEGGLSWFCITQIRKDEHTQHQDIEILDILDFGGYHLIKLSPNRSLRSILSKNTSSFSFKY